MYGHLVGVITTIYCLRVLRQINVRQEIAGKIFRVKMIPSDARSNEILAPSEIPSGTRITVRLRVTATNFY